MSKNIQLDEEALKSGLEAILAEIHNVDDPAELNAYRAAFRKYVPLFSRAYVAAYLLRKLKPVAQSGSPRRQSAVAAAPREGMTSIFIGIGKSRKVFPRDLMGLLIEQGQVSKEQIGSIKILDNYSFVEVTNDKCDALIEKLNNIEYRGRTVAVNYAKKRD